MLLLDKSLPMKALFSTMRRKSREAPKAILISLLVCLPWTALRVRSELVFDAFAWATNGPRMSWTDASSNQVYTVQVSTSLANGTWRNATTRYRWPWPFQRWGDVPRTASGAQFYRVLSQPSPTPERGKLLTQSSRAQYSASELGATFVEWGIADFVRPRFGTSERTFTYETVDPFGLTITASALMIVPRGTNGPIPLVSVQHGTLARKGAAPSQPGSGELWAVALAASGYAVVVPDYLGLGTSPGNQPYLHAKSEGTCVVDALRAGRSLCASNNVRLNGQIFLAGFSQGGHVTMAAHRELESFHAQEFTVTASAPSAGTYDLGGVTTESLISSTNYSIAYPFAMVVASYLPIYQLGDTLEELLAEPYRSRLPSLLGGAHTAEQINVVLPKDPIAVLRPDYQADFRSNPKNPLRQALLDNNTYGWTPRAPIKLIHCRKDEIAIYSNAENAFQSFTNRGACCVSLVDPGAPKELNHEDCYLPGLREILPWFATFAP